MMYRRSRNILLACLVFFIGGNAKAQTNRIAKQSTTFANARTILFDDNWKFIRDSINGAEQPNFDDQLWRTVRLPHDWSIEDLPVQIKDSISGPFTKASAGGTATGFVAGGTAWYRKTFVTQPGDQGKIVIISFDGVYMDADVWLNGHHLGNHPYGYTPFNFELSKWLQPAGETNVLAVRVRNTGKNSRWYSGSGIYRHVWLIRTEQVHIPVWGIAITTPDIAADRTPVHIVTTVDNQGRQQADIRVETFLKAPDGLTVGHTMSPLSLKPESEEHINQNISVAQPLLWSVEHPRLYTAISYIRMGNKTIDSTETVFGIRNIKVDSKNGLLINGKKVLLKGGCMHHDNGPLGSAAIDRAEERKIELLKQNGFNAIRTSHNPPSQQLLDACDRLGMLVIDEAFDMWERPKNPDDYHQYFDQWWKQDLQSKILRDRNHPSVLFWSIGNEINERADTFGLQLAQQLVNEVHQLDRTRPVTEAICSFWDHPGRSWDATAPAFALLDVGGYNYQWKAYEHDHEKYPERIMMGTESIPGEAFENWQMVEKHPYVIGDFVWTAVDYMGETAIGHSILSNQKDSFSLGWPWYDAYCGDIDLAGNKKPQSYYRDVVWRRSKIEMAVHCPLPDSLKEQISYWGWPDEMQSWTWPGFEGKLLQVRVFSRSPRVRLLLNGKMIGEQAIPDSSITAVFEVPYESGIIKAMALENGKEAGSIIFQTAGEPKHLKLRADRAVIKPDQNDLSYITVAVTDDKGNIVPNAALPIHFTVTGAGTLAATGSGDPKDMSSFHQPERKTFRGRCLVIVRPKGETGTIRIRATAEGLTPAELTVKVRE